MEIASEGACRYDVRAAYNRCCHHNDMSGTIKLRPVGDPGQPDEGHVLVIRPDAYHRPDAVLHRTQLKMSDIKDAMHRGVLLILVRLGVAYALCALFYALFGFDGESGFGEAQVMQIISLIIPFILGNMDEDIRKVFAGGNAIILTDPAMHPSQAARLPVLRSLSLQWRQHPTRRLSPM